MTSAVASAQTGKGVWTVTTGLKAVDVHARLAHMHPWECGVGRWGASLGGVFHSHAHAHAHALG